MIDGLDRVCFDLSSKCVEPLCHAFGLLRYRLILPADRFDTYRNKLSETAYRISIVVGACFIASIGAPVFVLCGVLGVASKLFRAMGCYFQKEGYTHVKGLAKEKEVGSDLRVMTWNVLGLTGGLHYSHGGVIPWSQRIDQIVKKIEEEDPDVLFLQEVFDTALAEALIEKLKTKYAHFFFHLGPNVWGTESGCMMITKCGYDKFSFTSFPTNDWTVNRGVSELEMKNVKIVGVHLQHGSDQDPRDRQMEYLFQKVVVDKPTVVMGDFNTEYSEKWTEQLTHGYDGTAPTCTNRLAAQWDGTSQAPEETIDYISLVKKNAQETVLDECHLVNAFDESFDTRTAISDHHGIILTIKRLSVV